KSVELHDGSRILLRKLEADYDPTNRRAAMRRLEEALQHQEFITGLIYFDDSRQNLAEVEHVSGEPLARLPEAKLRPSREKLDAVMGKFL
ncbi:MAG TPA: 2-oxoacid:ferredoxin oxidoreductase subunit beta, partial [Candidatus Binatia bacterium]|nr:2-oxoacid:ferredoxin oxidoreductase subunit beta [Candidatus Binatia bacterium]